MFDGAGVLLSVQGHDVRGGRAETSAGITTLFDARGGIVGTLLVTGDPSVLVGARGTRLGTATQGGAHATISLQDGSTFTLVSARASIRPRIGDHPYQD